MNIADCYRVLGLRTGASYEEVKASYRRLARQLHPDINPGNQQAQERFIRITEAYRFLLTVIAPVNEENPDPAPPPPPEKPKQQEPVKVKITRKEPPKKEPVLFTTDLSLADQHLKRSSYEQLQQLFRAKKFPRAITLVEGLAQRFPKDPEIREWQAITYQQWGKQLIRDREHEKARLYLKKALHTDPHNQRLWADVEQDFRRLEQAMYRRR
jgi:tetratricopeptide (TPR) repeat protein